MDPILQLIMCFALFKINSTPHTGSDMKTSEKDQAKSEIIVSVISNDPPCKNAKIVISDSQ